MASIQQRGDRFQVRIKNKVLPKTLFFTFDTEAEAVAYRDSATRLLDQGIVPASLMRLAEEKTLQQEAEKKLYQLPAVILSYLKSAPVTSSDAALLPVIQRELVGVSVGDVTFAWATKYVASLKLDRQGAMGAKRRRLGNLAPGSIRKRVEALARVLDWHFRCISKGQEAPRHNPLRHLPRGYSLYSDAEKNQLEREGRTGKRDVMRDRRITSAEIGVLLNALEHGRARGEATAAVKADAQMLMLLSLALYTGMRLKEMYTLRVDQIDFAGGFIRVEGSKGHRGAIKPRNVPMRQALHAPLRAFTKDRNGLVFDFWSGTRDDLKRCSSTLSRKCKDLFAACGVHGCTQHDLRHTACCEWFELRRPEGAWVFSDVEICKIMGWSKYSMILRYASLRGEDLASRLKGL